MVAQEEWSPPRASLRQQNPAYRSAHRKAAAPVLYRGPRLPYVLDYLAEKYSSVPWW